MHDNPLPTEVVELVVVVSVFWLRVIDPTHRAVGQSIALHSYGLMALPTKKEFDWTLGDGAASLGGTEGAAYALFMFGDGTFADGGRVAMTVAMAMLGVGMDMGGQQVFVSLVELKTGRVVWSNYVIAGANDF